MQTFNAPPGWPVPGAGWTPPPGWEPEPGWPPAPEGWTFWLEESAAGDAPGSAASAQDPLSHEAVRARLQDAANRRFLVGAMFLLGGALFTRLSAALSLGTFHVVYWGAMLVGGYTVLQGVVAHASASSEARKIVAAAQAARHEARPAVTAVEAREAAEATQRAQAEREQQEAERRERFASLGAVPALLADESVARQARKIKQMYGSKVCAQFLNRKAGELGLGDLDLTEDDIPDSL